MHICTPNHLHLPLAEAALAAGKHVICEKPLAIDAAGAAALVDAAAVAPAPRRPCRSSTATTRRCARPATRVRAGATGPSGCIHGTYLQDWLLEPEDDNWRVDAALGGASRAFADIGSHWCDLAEFVSGHRITRLSARTLTAVPERLHARARGRVRAAANGGGEKRAVDTEDAAIVQFETDGGALGTDDHQPDLGRPQEPPAGSSSTAPRKRVAFDQEEPETLWIGTPRGTHARPRAIPGSSRPRPRALATLPAGHPQGYADCFDLSSPRRYAAARGEAPAGRPAALRRRPARGADHEAVLASAREERWVDVPAVAVEVTP